MPARAARQTSEEIPLIIHDVLAAAERVTAVRAEGARMQERWILERTRVQCAAILLSAREDLQTLTAWLEQLSAGTTTLGELQRLAEDGAALFGEMATVQRDIYEEILKRFGPLLRRPTLQVPPRRS